MSEFVGRTGSKRVYSYPEAKFSGLIGPFARNGAAGPGSDVNAAPGGTTINWVLIESTGASGTNVPITPVSTGKILITGVMALHNVGLSAQDVTVQILVDGTPLAVPPIDISIPDASFAELPFMAFTTLAVGATANISVVVTGSTDVNIVNFGTLMQVLEVQIATG